MLESAVIGCLRDAQLIGPPQNSIMYPDVLFLFSTSQNALSVYTSLLLLYVIPKCLVPYKYLKLLLTLVMLISEGFCVSLLWYATA